MISTGNDNRTSVRVLFSRYQTNVFDEQRYILVYGALALKFALAEPKQQRTRRNSGRLRRVKCQKILIAIKNTCEFKNKRQNKKKKKQKQKLITHGQHEQRRLRRTERENQNDDGGGPGLISMARMNYSGGDGCDLCCSTAVAGRLWYLFVSWKEKRN